MPSDFSRVIIDIVSSKRAKREAVGEGGLLSGQDPSAFNTSDPLRLWIIQVGVIILTTQILALGLRKIRQPKVIAEVLSGIILGPTACGRIPGFREHIFPTESLPYLSLVANIGLCLFLFLVGLEIDASVIRRNAKLSAIISISGMALPFGLGAGLAVPLYHHFIDPSIKFTDFMLFTGVAYSITAFPVLCRILTELKLLDTTVGIVVLSAGVGNDIVGWTLLALSVALVNAGSGVMALYILLTCIAWTLFLLFVVRRALRWMAIQTGSIENGPTMFFMTTIMFVLFASAFFTDVIGVHAIFGAFLTGLIVPREGGLPMHLTEKLEDMVSIVFLPLYFILSGLSTNLGLLDNGITWAFTIAICSLAYTGKFGGCTLAAHFVAGFSWREASTIGTLMSCKGLVELIVLNVGLSAGILNQRVFSMFVLEALLLTFMTTPVVTILYPPERRVRAYPGTAKIADSDGQESVEKGDTARTSGAEDDGWKTRYTVVLDKIEHLPGMMAMTQLLQLPGASEDDISATTGNASSTEMSEKAVMKPKVPEMRVDALRLIELSDRTSAVMKALDTAADTLIHADPLLGIFRTYSEQYDVPVSTSLAIVQYDDLAANVVEHASQMNSQLIVVPWLPPYIPVETAPPASPRPNAAPLSNYNPFDMFFRATQEGHQHHAHPASVLHSHFIRGVFARATTDVALFVDRGRAPGESRTAGSRNHIYLPWFGGPDDRLALDLVVQLCANPKTTATVVRVAKRDEAVAAAANAGQLEKPEVAYLGEDAASHLRGHSMTVQSTTAGMPDTVYGHHNTATRLQSETADNVAWERYASHIAQPHAPSLLSSALSRVDFVDLETSQPLHAIIEQAATHLDNSIKKRTRLLVLTGRSRRLAVENHAQELKQIAEAHRDHNVGSEVRKTIGDVATAFVVSGSSSNVGLVVVQAAHTS